MNENSDKNKVIIDDIIYELKSNGEAIVVGNAINNIIDLELSGKIKYNDKIYALVEIGEESFYENSYIDSVLIPSTVKKIGKKAFQRSSLKYIYFMQMVALHPVEFAEACFMDCIRLKEVQLPSGLIEIPRFSFANCVRLEKINTPFRIQRIMEMAFWQCESLKHFDFTTDIIEIGDSAFQSTNIYYAEISSNVKKVGNLSFAHIVNLKAMVILGIEAEFGDYFMKNDQRVTTYLKGNKEEEKVIELQKQISDPHYFVVDDFNMVEDQGAKFLLFSKNVARLVGYNEDDLKTNLIIPERIENVPVVDFQPGAFKYSQKLESCTFPNTIVRIKGKVFEECKKLESVTFQHEISSEEAKWVVYNENVQIIINNDI
jgi:hypothetical protein